ncbi:hypothetical protein ACWDTI_11405 [Gordonia sp. NPDC003424]
MSNTTKASVAALAALAVVGGAAIGSGPADAAPRVATFPALQQGTTVNGWGWTGTLLSRAQSYDAYRTGILGALGSSLVQAYEKATTPGRGAGCIVIFHATKGSNVENGATYIRQVKYAAETPDTANAMYWSTRNFRCA